MSSARVGLPHKLIGNVLLAVDGDVTVCPRVGAIPALYMTRSNDILVYAVNEGGDGTVRKESRAIFSGVALCGSSRLCSGAVETSGVPVCTERVSLQARAAKKYLPPKSNP